jgi:hypothetical protein
MPSLAPISPTYTKITANIARSSLSTTPPTTDKALKQQIMGAINKLYLRTLNHCITGFADVTTRQMIVHLYITYGHFAPADIQNNNAAMKQPYNANKPIKTLFHQIKESI